MLAMRQPRGSGGVRPKRVTPATAARSSVAESTCGSLSDYVKVRTVGRGSFGEALLVKHRSTGQLSVLKRVRLEVIGSGSDAAAAESAAREAQVLHQLRHPHIVEFLAAFVDSSRDSSGGTLCLLMAFCEGGDLQHRLQKVRQECRRLQEQPALRWFDELCSALAYVHQRQVLHRDLKPSNIFLTGRSSGIANLINEEESVAIGDFGVSRPLTHAMELVTTMVGTPCYLSPEVCKGRPYSYKSDIWSLGCVLFEMMALRPPFGTAPNLEALVSRIVRADVNLPDNITNEYPEASRCTRAMLRQQPDRRPSAMSLLNRPRLQPPTYELPGMQPESTRDTKLFDPPSREHRDRDRDHRELGSRPRHLGEPVPNGAKAAFSPRTNVRTKLTNQVLDESDEKFGIHQYVTHKGIIDDAIGRPRQTGTTGTQARPTYPASPAIVATSGSETRTGSREARSARSFGQPLSARPKAYQAQPQPLQRSPRSPGPADHTEHGTGTRSSSTPRSPCEDRSSKFQHRREERCRQSQAFRQWLREQRAKGKESPGAMADSSQSPKQEESSPCEFSPQSVVATATESAGEPGDKLNESRETASSRSPTSPSQPRLRKPKMSQPRQEWRTEIYCPGFPVITVEDEAAEERQDQLEPSRSLSAVPEHPQHGTSPEESKLPLPTDRAAVRQAEPTPRGPADVGGTPADTMEVVVQKLVTEADNMTFEIEASDTHPFVVDKMHEGQPEGKLAMRSRLCSGNPDPSKVEVKQECLGLPKDLDDSKKSVSIGDRIEGIRACLEARMGTHRFQKLYKSLTKDDSVVNNLSGSSVSWPRDSSMFLPEDIDEAFVGAGDGGSDDINSLIPLVAKLVACEQSYFS